MKILHISTYDIGGAGISCCRLHKGLLANGFDSKVLVLNKMSNEPGVYKYEQLTQKPPKIIRWPILFAKLILKKFRIPISKQQYYQFVLDKLRIHSSPVYSLPFSDHDLSTYPLVKDADIIHLHWVCGFLDYPSFFKIVIKPVIWTIHDENLYYGGFHYLRDLNANLSKYSILENKLLKIKAESIKSCEKLFIVSLSQMMLRLSLSSNIVKNRKHYLINNAVDKSIFMPYEKTFCRNIFNLPKDKTILIFISYYLNDKNKGFSELILALNKLNLQDILLFAVGMGRAEITPEFEIQYSGVINDPRLLTLAYSAADIYVMPSFQEAFAQTPLEAMACGLPVVAFPCSGTEELINERNGVRAEDFTVESLKNSIERAINTEFDGRWIRKDVITRFSINNIVESYAQVYEDAMRETDN